MGSGEVERLLERSGRGSRLVVVVVATAALAKPTKDVIGDEFADSLFVWTLLPQQWPTTR